MAKPAKPTLCVDFDGVVHSYERGWYGGEIYGTVVPGFFEWCERVAPHFKIAIYSSRSADPARKTAMESWLLDRYVAWCGKDIGRELIGLEFVHQKPPAWLTIDDRCIRFRGNWNALELDPDALLNFLPWMDEV